MVVRRIRAYVSTYLYVCVRTDAFFLFIFSENIYEPPLSDLSFEKTCGGEREEEWGDDREGGSLLEISRKGSRAERRDETLEDERNMK